MIPDGWIFDGGPAGGDAWSSEDFFAEIRKIAGIKEEDLSREDFEERMESLHLEVRSALSSLKELGQKEGLLTPSVELGLENALKHFDKAWTEIWRAWEKKQSS